MVFNQGATASQKTFGDVWRHLQLSQLEGHNCHLVGREQGCRLTSYNAHDSRHNRVIWPQMTLFRNLALSLTTSFLHSNTWNQNRRFGGLLPTQLEFHGKWSSGRCSAPPSTERRARHTSLSNLAPPALSWASTATSRCLAPTN